MQQHQRHHHVQQPQQQEQQQQQQAGFIKELVQPMMCRPQKNLRLSVGLVVVEAVVVVVVHSQRSLGWVLKAICSVVEAE
jgi:hypothetical protein